MAGSRATYRDEESPREAVYAAGCRCLGGLCTLDR